MVFMGSLISGVFLKEERSNNLKSTISSASNAQITAQSAEPGDTLQAPCTSQESSITTSLDA